MKRDPPGPVDVVILGRARDARAAPEPALPSAAAMAGHAIGALGRIAGAVASGARVTVDESEMARRLAICEGCEHFRRSDRRCALCGCYMRLKSAILQEKCPINKW